MLKTLHGFTEKVIAERKQELKEKLKVVGQEEQEEVIMMRIFVDMIFTRPLLQKGLSLQEEILSVCPFVCLSVRHHFFLFRIFNNLMI